MAFLGRVEGLAGREGSLEGWRTFLLTRIRRETLARTVVGTVPQFCCEILGNILK